MNTNEMQIARARIGGGEAVLAATRPSVEAWRARNGLEASLRRSFLVARIGMALSQFGVAGLTALVVAQNLWSPLAMEAFVDWVTGAWVLILGALAIWRWNLRRIVAFEHVSGLMRRTVFALTSEAVYVIVEGGEAVRYDISGFREIAVRPLYEGAGDVAFRGAAKEVVLPAVPNAEGFVSRIVMARS